MLTANQCMVITCVV